MKDYLIEIINGWMFNLFDSNWMYNTASSGMFKPNKSQFYYPDGTGRDPYVYANNGGFCPEKQTHKIEEIGKFSRLRLVR